MVAILSIGEALVEVMRAERDVPLDRPGSLVGPYPSGAPAILASAAARLGASVGFCGTVGEDAFGHCVHRRLLADGIDCAALRRTRDEVPHAVAVEVGAVTERRDRPLVEVEAYLIVESESQKAIVVGKAGRVVKAIGSAARREIESVLGVQVFLDLRVKVRRRWRRDDRFVEQLL